jgi:beta-glucosidase
MITSNYSPAWSASQSEADQAVADAYDILHNRMFTDPVLLGRYPDLTLFGLGDADAASEQAWVQDGDLTVISASVDAIGVNYYMPTRLSAFPDSPLPFQMEPIPGYPVTSFGWPVVPACMTELLSLLAQRYGTALRRCLSPKTAPQMMMTCPPTARSTTSSELPTLTANCEQYMLPSPPASMCAATSTGP